MTQIASEGQILVSSTTEQQPTDRGHDQDGPLAAPKRSGKSRKEEGQVSQALRTVYQRAVEEDIPAEMLDLLSKLD
ncbi:NepR family anti-sigma factor [Sphingobium abikonense]|uniref:NepR family anti-sigma factor n=1 Tax=Sphingobium abikonense TaxID=86193 RepID=UPI000787F91F|nr:NepR family anti-sigma factor [Sphingobium abikonense]